MQFEVAGAADPLNIEWPAIIGMVHFNVGAAARA